jgi:hypothetical protein
MDNDWTRVPEGHPEQCETQECMNKRMEGSAFCPAHGGNKGNESFKKKELRNYRLSKFHNSINEKSNSSALKSLTEEIAILRQIVEEQLNSCEDSSDLILKSGPISDLTVKINTLVTSCNNIDKTLNNLIDREAVVSFAQTIVSIITPKLNEQDIEEVTNKILEAIGEL